MGIRDTSYYGWSTIDDYFPIDDHQNTIIISASFYNVCLDTSGSIYTLCRAYLTSSTAVAKYNSYIRKSSNQGISWKNIFTTASCGLIGLGVDPEDRLYTFGGGSVFVSSDRGNLWNKYTPSNVVSDFVSPTDQLFYYKAGIDFHSTGTFVSVGQRIFSSSDAGQTWGKISLLSPAPDQGPFSDVYVSGGVVLYCGGFNGGQDEGIHRSTNTTTWSELKDDTGNAYNEFLACATSGSSIFFSTAPSTFGNTAFIFSSSDNGTTFASQSMVFLDDVGLGVPDYTAFIPEINVHHQTGHVYAFGGLSFIDPAQNVGFKPDIADWFVAKTLNSGTTWSLIDRIPYGCVLDSKIISDETIYAAGVIKNRAVLRKGRLAANSSSIGLRLLTPSFGYVLSESFKNLKTVNFTTLTDGDHNRNLYTLVTEEQFNLNNISEFPHSSGLFQMPNIVLGTKTSGKAGKTDDSIVQKRFIGSFVRVLWPKQEDADSKGYEIARQPGKLLTTWEPGEIVDIDGKGFDHLALNCAASTLVSGTMDSILVRVETRGLNSSGFMIDQTIEQTISSSFESEALLRDDVFRKQIDYGDVSLTERSWKINVPLENVKEIRISCRQKAGQSEEKNKQFIVMGRFITKSKDHNET